MNKSIQHILPEAIFATMRSYIKTNRWIVAFSGGLDSSVLLHAVVFLAKKYSLPEIRALHINHQLQQQANDWELFCKKFCKQQGIPISLTKITIVQQDIKTHGLEQAARIGRYNIFNNILKSNDCLLQGHHQNDQAETLLLRLFRGTGIDGLVGIPQNRKLTNATLIRPILQFSKQQLYEYAKSYNIDFIEDPSNTNINFDRNFIRHQILPQLESRWPKLVGKISAIAKEAQDVATIIEQHTQTNLQACLLEKKDILLEQYSGLVIDKLLQYKATDQQRIIRLWLKNNNILSPSRDMTNRILTEVANATQNAAPKIKLNSKYSIQRYINYLLLVPEITKLNIDIHNWHWREKPQIKLNSIVLTMVATTAKDKLSMYLPTDIIQIKFRQHIESNLKFNIYNRIGSKKFKKLLQEYNVPPWMRNNLPIIFNDKQMVAAAGLWVCNEFKAKDNQQAYKCIVSFCNT